MRNFLKVMISKNGEFSKTSVMLWLVVLNGLVLMNLESFEAIKSFPKDAIIVLAGIAGGTYTLANSKKIMGG